MKQLSATQAAYIAGFLDGDGSLIAQFKKNPTSVKNNRIGYQFQMTVQFTQDGRNKHLLEEIKKETGLGPKDLRSRKSNSKGTTMIYDLIITAVDQIQDLLIAIKPYVRGKKGQLNKILRIIELKPQMFTSEKLFSEVCDLVDEISAESYSKSTRIHTGASVLQHVITNRLLVDPTP